MIQILSEVAKNAVKEKVIRIVVQTFRVGSTATVNAHATDAAIRQNLLTKAPAANAPALLGSKVLPLSESLASRKWSDEEIEEDLQYLIDELKQKLKNMRYVHAVAVRALGPP